MKYLAGAAALCMALATTAAQAEDWTGVYIAGQGGLVRMSDRATGGGTYTSKDGWVGSAAVGYAFPFHMRAEIEGAMTDGNKFDAGKVPAIDAGKVQMSGQRVMANLYYDIPTGTAIKPYIGAGAGVMRVHSKANEYVGANLITVDDNDSSVTWQGAAGVAYNLIDKVDLTLDYRYFETQKMNFDYAVNGTPTGRTGGSLYGSEFRAGVRWGF